MALSFGPGLRGDFGDLAGSEFGQCGEDVAQVGLHNLFTGLPKSTNDRTQKTNEYNIGEKAKFHTDAERLQLGVRLKTRRKLLERLRF